MKEWPEILPEITRLAPDEKTILGTVVEVKGSRNWQLGAKLLILGSGKIFGPVSGECFEADFMESAKKVLQTGKPQVFIYHTTKDENSVFTLNIGCQGSIRIFLEPVNKDNLLFTALQITEQYRIKHVIATLISAPSNGSWKIGWRVFFNPIVRFYFADFPDFLKNFPDLKNDCIKMLKENQKSQLRVYETGQGNFEFLFEWSRPGHWALWL